MRAKLRVLKNENAKNYSRREHLRFAVVDLDRAGDYPLNFVCMLPMGIGSKGAMSTVFERVFGDSSLEVARELLTDALKNVDDIEVRNEIERRLRLLVPESSLRKTCVSCGKTFEADPEKKRSQKFCEACMRKKFGDRK